VRLLKHAGPGLESLSESAALLGSSAGFRRDSLLDECLLDGVFELIGLEAEGAPAARIAELAVGAHEIESIGPALVGLADLVVDLVDDRRDHLETEIHDTLAGHTEAFVSGHRILDDRAAETRAPAIDGMRFLDVDEEELDLVTIALIEGLQPTG
jgi:hypothetical protein